MSYILEALKKSDAERKRGEVPTLSDGIPAPAYSAPAPRNPLVLIAGVAGIFIAVSAIGAWFLLGDDGQPAPMQQNGQQNGQQAALTPPQPQAAPAPTPKPEPVAEPEPASAPTPAPEPVAAEPVAPEPVMPEPVMPEPVAPEPVAPEPMPAAQEVSVLEAKPAPAPKVETGSTPIPEPVLVVKPEPKPEPKPISRPKPVPETKTKPNVRALPALKSAGAYVDRAWTSMDKGLYAQAIDDLDRALGQEPAYADAWFARGWANEKNADLKAALRDYTRASNADPSHAFALFSRGYLNLYVGDARDAVVDFVRVLGVTESENLRQFSHLWLYLSRARAGQDAANLLRDEAAGENLKVWPGPLIKHYMGQSQEPAVLKAIESGNPEGLRERRVTGYFFLGISAQLANDSKRARRYFEKALATGAVNFRQYDAAKRELDALR